MDINASLKIIPKLMETYAIGSALNSAYSLAYLKAVEKAFEVQDRAARLTATQGGDEIPLFYDTWLTLSDNELNKELKSKTFTSLLSQYANALVELHSMIRQTGYPIYYFRHLLNLYMKNIAMFDSIQNKNFEPTPYDIVFTKGKARLLHYHYYYDSSNTDKKTVTVHHNLHNHIKAQSLQLQSISSDLKQHQRPAVIITYAPINRFQIMDVTPDRSVVRALLSRGLDVYLLDWGYPELNDSNVSLFDYVDYLKDAVQSIKDQTGIDKISLLAYCWGGIIGTIYAALNNDNLKSLALMAVPIDSSKDNTTISSWLKTIDVDKMIDEFGSIDGMSLELAFTMRNPPRYAFDRFAKLYTRLYDKVFVKTFIALQKWLTDTPLIPGNLFRTIINDCYKNNMLISNKMQIDGNNDNDNDNDNDIIDLGKITVPLLTIVAEHDDIVSPESTLSIKSLVSSTEKTNFLNPGDHVGLCISTEAHKKLWPQVSEWILSQSKQ